MQPTHFRAYAPETVLSRRPDPNGPGNINVNHEVHNPAIEGDVKDGIAAFATKASIAYVAFYAGEGDEEVCVGHLDGPFGPGKVSADFADIPAVEPVDLGKGEFEVGGTIFRKAD